MKNIWKNGCWYPQKSKVLEKKQTNKNTKEEETVLE